jgi:DNA-binding beta-propeller fold protein YncE
MADPRSERVLPAHAAVVEEAVIEVDSTPHSVAASHDGSRMYVTHFLSGVVSVISCASKTVIDKYQRSSGIYGVTASVSDEFVYVANPSSTFVDRIGASDGSVLISAGINVAPYGLATSPDGHRLYAACALGGAIELLDPLVKNIARIIDVDFPVALAVSPDGSRLYTSNFGAGTVTVLDATAVEIGSFKNEAAVIARAPVAQNPYGIAVDPSGRRLFVAHFNSADVLSIVDLASLSTAGTINVGRGPIRGVAITPDGAELYVTNYFSGSVSVLRMPVGGT